MTKSAIAATGKIVRFEDNGCIAVLETKWGEALLDVNTDFDLRLRTGDNLEVTDATFYVTDGHIVTVINEDTHVVLNGHIVKFKAIA